MEQSRNSVNRDASKFPDEAAFLGPDETKGILSALEERDARMLASSEPRHIVSGEDEEGFFVSPQDLEKEGIEIKNSAPLPENNQPQPANPSVHSDILTRIAGELRSIKTELGSLKNNYDEMLARSETSAGSEWVEAPEDIGEASVNEQGAVRGPMPDDMQDDIKRLLVYLDRLLESLPEAKIDEFAGSEYFELYRKIFDHFNLS